MFVKKQVLLRKIEKKRQSALQFLKMQGGIDRYFHYVESKPTVEQFLDMVTVAFYGPLLADRSVYEPIRAGGDAFLLEYFLDGLKNIKKNYRNGVSLNNIGFTEDGVNEMMVLATQTEYWLNMGAAYVFDRNIIEHVDSLAVSDFVLVDDYSFLEKETQAAALRVFVTRPRAKTSALFSWLSEEYGWDMLGRMHPQWLESPYKSNDYASEYVVFFTTPERIKKFEDFEREKHNVKAHERHLQSGKVVDIRSHIRSNPLRSLRAALNTEEVDYIVYRVRDAVGVVRYFGEGTETRPAHVNSGVSHNYKINEHYFLKGKMKVEILKRYLSKQEALFVERMLIRNHTTSELWNIKEY